MLRALTEQDLPELLQVEALTQLSPWSLAVFKKCFEAGSIGWVVDCAGKIIGFVIILSQPTVDAHILNFGIHPDHQREGHGQQLLMFALASLKGMGTHWVYLEVRRSNYKAIALYQKLGFKLIGERKNYYMDEKEHEDALVFAKDLAAE